jgi:hypothetical protein
VRVRLYETIPVRGRVPSGTWVFSDLERLGEAGRELAVRLRDALTASSRPVRILNDPRVALDRFDLLTELYARGVNRFRAFRVNEPLPRDLRFPVVLRMERQHGGAITPLLPDFEALDAAVRSLTSIFRGYRRRDLLVVEYVDVSDGDGVYNRYTAYRVGDRIVPKRVEFSRSWSVSTHKRISDAETTAAEWEYVQGNPHADLLLPVFELAHIEYGRIDYGIKGDRIHVWEINTNPMIGGPTPPARRPRVGLEAESLPSRDLFHSTMAEALEEMTGPDKEEWVDVRIPPLLVARARVERADYRWRTRYRRWMKGLGRMSERMTATEGGGE